MYSILQSLDANTLEKTELRYSKLNPALECGSTLYYGIVSSWIVLLLAGIVWLFFSRRLYSSFADPVLLNSKTGYSASLSTYSCSLVILIRILIETVNSSTLIASKDVCSGILAAALTASVLC